MKKLIQKKSVIYFAILVLGMFLGWLIFSPSTHDHGNAELNSIESTSTVWTCSMDPQVRQPSPGKCPICGMDLIPLSSDEGADLQGVKMTPAAMQLANVQTTVVGSQSSSKEIRLNGKVMADERLISAQTSHIPGRIEQLLINFTGESIKKGQIIAKVYSPELVTAQHELLEAFKIRDSQPLLFQAAKEKLKNWKLSENQIQNIIDQGKPSELFPLHSDFSGIVLNRLVSVGDYVDQGEVLYDVGNLSRVWILFDVYEGDLQWIKVNDKIEYTVQSLPGEVFTAKISFVEPIINPQTRVATARVEVENPTGRLKPEMFASAIVKSAINVKKGNDVLIPKSAVMWTGERSIVYVKSIMEDGIYFTLREVLLGPSLGSSYLVKEGLRVGEEIATQGTFTIDAAAQLAGKPSMMNTSARQPTSSSHPEHMGEKQNDNEDSPGKIDDKFKEQLGQLLNPYLDVKDALVGTNAGAAAKAGKSFTTALRNVNMNLVQQDAHSAWMELLKVLQESSKKISESPDVEVQRVAFSDLSNAYYKAIQQFDVTGMQAYYQFCPMAFNNTGAFWISKTKPIRNPYFGDKMMTCGVTKSEIN